MEPFDLIRVIKWLFKRAVAFGIAAQELSAPRGCDVINVNINRLVDDEGQRVFE